MADKPNHEPKQRASRTKAAPERRVYHPGPRIADDASLGAGVEALRSQDPEFIGRLLAEGGPPPLRRREPGFAGLAAIVVSQQVSVASARSILGRLEAHLTRSDADAPRSFFMCLLVPPRPTFMADMTADERALMGAHAAYWRELAVRGSAVVFGPVAEANGGGGFGLGVLEAADEAEVRRMEARDPVILANVGFRYEVMPMLRAVLRSDLR